jgi:CheY-like chemotaxis protein
MQNQYDVVLMDCEMPVMDGLTACQKIRDWEKISGTTAIPLVMLSGHQTADFLQGGQGKEVDACLLKPVSLEQLNDILQRVL